MVNTDLELKIAISGKINTGKDTLYSILDEELWKRKITKRNHNSHKMSFAAPIKQMVLHMFPELPEEWLFGSSKLRNQIIPNAFKDGKPLTVRQLLLDLGTSGRQYNPNIWIDNFNHRLHNFTLGENVVICTDGRFRNEFDYLRSQDFFQVRLYRTSDQPAIQHESETKQHEIADSEFDYVLYNNAGLKELKQQVISELIPRLQKRLSL